MPVLVAVGSGTSTAAEELGVWEKVVETMPPLPVQV